MNECGVGISAAAFGAGDTNHAELFENLPKPSVTLSKATSIFLISFPLNVCITYAPRDRNLLLPLASATLHLF